MKDYLTILGAGLAGSEAAWQAAERGIPVALYEMRPVNPTPVHKTPFYKLKTKLPVTDWASSHVLSLPIHPNVTQKNIGFIAKTIREIL